MGISLVAAFGINREIGIDNRLPWQIPEDLKHFRELTLGKTVVMGRKTLESIGGPLPKRRNIVLTRDVAWKTEGCEVAHSVEEVIRLAQSEEVMVIGGEQVFRDFLPIADRLYLTEIEASFEADSFFPQIDPSQWQEVERIFHPGRGKRYSYRFLTLVRR